MTKKVLLILFAILIISGLVHGLNMFGYPAYLEDEGTYVSQAWAIIRQGRLAPYTYWYDHSPFGWILIALWNLLTGGFFTFGLSVNSGRVFMLVLHLLSTFLIFKIILKLTDKTSAAAIAALFFSLSPLGIVFQRLVLLDNIMVFWLLITLYILVSAKRLKHFLLSAVTFGLAVLAKESALVFFPIFLFSVVSTAHKNHKRFAVVKWISVSLVVISFYPLFALIKGELFPYGTFLGGSAPHVSLIETLAWQIERQGGSFLSYEWIQLDLTIIILGILTAFANLVTRKLPASVALPMLLFVYILYLVRGGEVLNWYIVPLIPLFSLNIGLLLGNLSVIVKKLPSFSYLLIVLFPLYSLSRQSYLFTAEKTQNQVASIKWIKENIPQNSVLVIDNFAYVDLKDRGAEYYWKVDKDPEIREAVLGNNWRNIDYIMVTPALKTTIYDKKLDFVREAYENSKLVISFNQYVEASEIYPIEIRKVGEKGDILEESWERYKDKFIDSNGKTIDLSDDGRTTSEGQSYSLLRAVIIGDREAFDRVWAWTWQNLKLPDKGLFAWHWGNKENGSFGIKDTGTATDADSDIAFALVLAYKKWGDEDYLDSAKIIINNIWNYEVVEVNGKHYLVAGDWAKEPKDGLYTLNPSYLSPYSYRIFSLFDLEHDWRSLVNTSYEVLSKCSNSFLEDYESNGIPPDWCSLDSKGQVKAPTYLKEGSSDYSYDAIRVLWRVALDYKWSNEKRAYDYLKGMVLWKKEWQKGKLYASYRHNGEPKDLYESLAHYGTQLAFFSVIDKSVSEEIYTQKVLPKLFEDNNYYDANWLWFGTALYLNKIDNPFDFLDSI